MELTAELRRSHRELGRLAEPFLDHVTRSPEGVRRTTFAALQQEAAAPLAGWPVFVGGETLREMKRAALDVTRLVKQIPFRVFRGALPAMAAFYQLGSPAAAAAILAEPNGIDGALARVDLLRTADGFKVLEVNLGGVGGFEVPEAAERHEAIPVIRRFLDAQPVGVRCTSAVEAVLEHLVAEAEGLALPSPELNVAIVVEEQFPAARHAALLERFGHGLEAILRRRSLPWPGRIVMGPASRLEDRGDGLAMHGRPLAAILEWAPWHRQLAFPYWKSRRLNLYSGPAALVLADKRNLAFLSELEASSLLAGEEREAVRRWVPWTRQVKPGYTHRGGERFHLAEYLAAHREELVLKPAREGEGRDVHFGAAVVPAQWERLVREALERRDWVVQEQLKSLPYLFQEGEEGVGVCDMVWGVFVFGARYGGGFLRLMPQGRQQAINTARGARETLLFEEEEPSACSPA